MRLLIPTLVLSLVAAACGGPSDAELASVVKQHLSGAAPDGLPDDSWDVVTVAPVERVDAADGSVELAFRVFNPETATTDELRGPLYSAKLVADDDGWRVDAYGDGLARSVAVMVAKHRRGAYAALMDTFPHFQLAIRSVTSDWTRPSRDALRAGVSGTRLEEVRDFLEAGIPADSLVDGLRSLGWGADGTFVIGAVDDDPTDGAEAVWIRLADDEDTVCGRGLRDGTPPSMPWLVGHFPTCNGPHGVYVEQYPPETILAEIRARGVAPPAT